MASAAPADASQPNRSDADEPAGRPPRIRKPRARQFLERRPHTGDSRIAVLRLDRSRAHRRGMAGDLLSRRRSLDPAAVAFLGRRRRLAADSVGRAAAQYGRELPARHRRPDRRRRHRISPRPRQWRIEDQRRFDRLHLADGAQHSASRHDPAGHPMVRNRRGGQAVSRLGRRVLPRSTSTRCTAFAPSIRISSRWRGAMA